MAFVIAIADCSRKELLRKAVKTEAGWTSALYAFLSLGSEYELLDVQISSDGNTEWTTGSWNSSQNSVSSSGSSTSCSGSFEPQLTKNPIKMLLAY